MSGRVAACAARRGWAMNFLKRAALLGALALWSAPAAALDVALAAPSTIGAPILPSDAPLLSPLEQAVENALASAGPGREAIDKAVFDGVRAFYEARDFEPAWIGEGRANRQMSALRRHMDRAAEYGLDPADYPTPGFALSYPADPALVAAADVAFSRAAARFVTHLASGRLRPADVSGLITLQPERPDVVAVLTRLSQSAGAAVALRNYEPPHAQYRALKAKLAELSAGAAAPEPVVVPAGRLIRPGAADARVPLLRERLGLASVAGEEAETFDAALLEAVKAFQREHGLGPDGVVGARTLAALNGPAPAVDRATILVNMERWRWMPRDLGSFHVMVNVPEFMVRVVSGEATVHETRVVVGKPGSRTPIFSNVIDHLVVNPYWNVPTSILTNEMMSGIRQDPYGYMARHGYQVLARAGGKMRVVDPGSIDWFNLNPRSIRVRQVPGDANALGRIKFMFPNEHAVYLHDTPSRSLFRRDMRAFSHGCVRVDDPLDFADALLAVAAPDWNSKRLERLYGGPERRVNLDHPVPIHLSYFTLTVEADATARRSADLYGYDKEMAALLKL
jgi:murein L,D-transpeptidase YcbB/YkuD